MTLPDGPKTPRFLQLIQWIADPLTYMDVCAKKYGEIFTTRWGNLEPFVMIHNPQAIQEMLNSKAFDQKFLDGTSPRIYPWNQSKISNLKSSSPRIYPWGKSKI